MPKKEKKEDLSPEPEKEKEEDADQEAENLEEKPSEEKQEEENQGEQNLDYYKKIAQEEKEGREKAEKALAEQRYASKKKKEDIEEEEIEEEEEEKPLTASQLKSILAGERQRTQKEIQTSYIKDSARKTAKSEEEAEAIVEIHKSRTFPDYMTLEEQIAESQIIVNGKKLLAQNAELKRALGSKENKSLGGSENTYRDAPKAGEPKLAENDKAELSRLGFSWDGKFFSKKLASGKTLYRDWKSKKTWVSK
ncbi:MAG: hypothetical protein AAB456_04185 [Patescibacteria group bacterium]